MAAQQRYEGSGLGSGAGDQSSPAEPTPIPTSSGDAPDGGVSPTVGFELAQVWQDAPLYLPGPGNTLLDTTFRAKAGDQVVLVDQPQQKVTRTGGSGLFTPISAARAGASGAGTIFWIDQGTLVQPTGGSSSPSSSSPILLLVVAGLAVYLLWGE